MTAGNKLKLVDCCDRSVVKFAHQRLGPYYARGYLTTPPKRGGPPESACTYMYAASGTAGKYLRLGDAKDESGDPAAEFSFFEKYVCCMLFTLVFVDGARALGARLAGDCWAGPESLQLQPPR